MKNNMFLILFANCIPVKGAKRSLICDLQRSKIDFIPNTMVDFLNESKYKSIADLKKEYGNENQTIIDEYISYIVNKEYGFICNSEEEKNRFTAIDENFEVPCIIENAIIDVDENSDHDFNNIANQLDALGCNGLQIRIYSEVPLSKIRNIVSSFNYSRIEYIELLLKYYKELSNVELLNIVSKNARIDSITLHSCPESFNIESNGTFLKVQTTTQVISSSEHCGVIVPEYFHINLPSFLEAKKYNTCLNRKISIDKDGYIKNCPTMSRSFGNIKNTLLATALGKPGFIKLWSVNKDQISVCKDCEFRYICSDCRAFLNQNHIHDKPEKCNYNPYNATWAKNV